MKKSHLIFIGLVCFIMVLPLMTLDTWMPADIRLDTGDTAGANDSYKPQITCSGNNVYAVWHDNRNGSNDIYFNYSTDNGVNWQSSDIRLDTDTAGANNSGGAKITCDGNYVYAVWVDDRNGNSDIYFNYSSDNGVNWQASDIRLDTGDSPGASSSNYPQITCNGNYVYTVWIDDRNGNSDIYFNYSSDNGANWQLSDFRIDNDDVFPLNNGSYDPQIASSGNNVYVVWEDSRNGYSDIYLNFSNDNGVNWQSSDVRVDKGDVEGTHISWDPQISTSGNSVYVVWRDERDSIFPNLDIFFNRSTDSGVNWYSQAKQVSIMGGDQYDTIAPQIACNGSNVYVVWQDEREGSGKYDIYFNYSIDSGGSWKSSLNIRLNTDPAGENDSKSPQIACSESQVYAVWKDNRNGNSDVYFNYSADNGANWQSSDTRLNTDPAGVNIAGNPQIACSENYVHVVWTDNRNGSGDIYYNYNGSVEPESDIKANGSDGPISITQLDTLQIRVTLNSNGLTDNVDYWLAYKSPSGWVHYNNTTKKWESGLGVTHQGPLMDLNNKKVFQSKLSPGNYTFYFGVDMNMDGKVTKSSLYKDEVKVTVTQ